MSIYEQQPIDRTGLRTISIAERPAKVTVSQFARPYGKGHGVASLIDSLPHILAADSLRAVRDAILAAKEKRKLILWGLGGHVIKVGLAPVLIDLISRGFVNGLAMNGSTAIHDFEIALAGSTSEDVDVALPGGRFGMAEETGAWTNQAIAAADRDGIGLGEGLGQFLQARSQQPGNSANIRQYEGASLLLQAYRHKIPVTVHVAIGTDTPHNYPTADGHVIGGASHRDFLLLAGLLRNLDAGGVYLNIGSAVILPEVFLKAVSLVRNLGHPLQNFTTVNMDFLQHYRPLENVVRRPTLENGRGYALTGHHEIMLPLLAAALIEASD
jgi:hypothetical protein